MNTTLKRRDRFDSLHTSAAAFWMIKLMHDNPLLPHFKNPYRLLEAAGLRPGQTVMEVGCGPGFFTFPAARIVGESGLIYATDVSPLAVRSVERKIRKQGVKNVVPVLADAASSGLPDNSVDLSFVFGLRHIAGGLGSLLADIYRVLKPGGLLSFENTSGSAAILTAEAGKAGFSGAGKTGRILKFVKSITSKTA